MKIVNHIKTSEKKNPIPTPGQIWLDTTSGLPYLLTKSPLHLYSLASVHSGNHYHEPERDVSRVFGKDREDFILVEAELHIMREI